MILWQIQHRGSLVYRLSSVQFKANRNKASNKETDNEGTICQRSISINFLNRSFSIKADIWLYCFNSFQFLAGFLLVPTVRGLACNIDSQCPSTHYWNTRIHRCRRGIRPASACKKDTDCKGGAFDWCIPTARPSVNECVNYWPYRVDLDCELPARCNMHADPYERICVVPVENKYIWNLFWSSSAV